MPIVLRASEKQLLGFGLSMALWLVLYRIWFYLTFVNRGPLPLPFTWKGLPEFHVRHIVGQMQGHNY